MFFIAEIQSVRHEKENTKAGNTYPESYSYTVVDKTRGPRLDKVAQVRVSKEDHLALVAEAKKAKIPEDLQDVRVTVSATGLREFSGVPFIRGQVMLGSDHFKALAKAALESAN